MDTDFVPNENPTKSGRRKKKKEKKDKNLVRCVSVAHSQTGVVIYDKAYKWPEGTQLTSVGGLSQSFYQFAREVDDGEIISIHFEGSGKGNSAHRRTISSASNTSSSSNRTRSTRHPPDTMKMVSKRDEIIIVNIFFDSKGTLLLPEATNQKLDDFLVEVFSSFSEHYSAAVTEHEDEILNVADERKTPTDEEIDQMKGYFSSFDSHLEIIRNECFPSHSSTPSSVSSVQSPREEKEEEEEEDDGMKSDS